jgi:hypothetical protein
VQPVETAGKRQALPPACSIIAPENKKSIALGMRNTLHFALQ